MTKCDRRRFLELSLAFAGACAAPPPARKPQAIATPPTSTYELVFKNGMVLDGLGNAARRADIGVRDGRIAFVGDLASARAATVLDVEGKHVCPGFIDLHSHADDTFVAHPNTESTVRQGVTTVVVGQDGSSNAPAKQQSFANYQAALEQHPPSINVASFVGQGRLRGQVMGDRPGRASAQEMAAMQTLAKEALAAGAFGISSGLEYQPGANASSDEIAELCSVLAPSRSIYMTHLRNEDDRLLEAIEEAIAITRKAGARLHVSHLKASGQRNWSKMEKALELVSAADATADCYPYVAYATTLQNLFPAEQRAGGTQTFLSALRDPKRGPVLRAAAESKVAMLGSWDSVMLTGLRNTARKDWDGRRVGELATSLHRAPTDVVVDLLIEVEGNAGMLGFGMSEENVAKGLAHDRVAVASDGSSLATLGPLSQRKTHPRSYGTFPRVLARFVRERPVLALPQAIRKMTSFPASILGLRDRGRIEPGAAADLVVFDPATVEDRATFEDAHRYPAGITQVLVNGQLVIDRDRHTGARAGRVLKRA
jgi:N-acyl-D-amino-acid deacylase